MAIILVFVCLLDGSSYVEYCIIFVTFKITTTAIPQEFFPLDFLSN